MSDDFTAAMRLCDDEGMVSSEAIRAPGEPPGDPTYLERHNRLARSTAAEPFHCTGHAHLGGEHIRCTSPAHEPVDWAPWTDALQGPGRCPGGCAGQHVLAPEDVDAARASIGGALAACLLCEARIFVPPVISIGEVA